MHHFQMMHVSNIVFLLSSPEACPLTVADEEILLMALCHFLVKNFILKTIIRPCDQLYSQTSAEFCFMYCTLWYALYLDTAITTRTAALNRPRGLRWEESRGDGRTPIVAIRHNVACSHS